MASGSDLGSTFEGRVELSPRRPWRKRRSSVAPKEDVSCSATPGVESVPPVMKLSNTSCEEGERDSAEEVAWFGPNCNVDEKGIGGEIVGGIGLESPICGLGEVDGGGKVAENSCVYSFGSCG